MTPAEGPEVATLSTLDRTIQKGMLLKHGLERDYHELAFGPGEPRVVCHELWPGPAPALETCASLIHLVHFTDLQIADVLSPGRVEFLESLRGGAGEDFYLPVSRPQEALTLHGFDALSRTIAALPPSVESGRPVELAVSTGDNIDNAQRNELEWYLALLSGGVIEQSPVAQSYVGAQAADWPGTWTWRPDGGDDRYRRLWGFPTHPGLLDEALARFETPGLGLPWLSCYGNHECLAAGTASPTEAYEHVVRGDRKPTRAPAGRDPAVETDLFCARPELFLSGPSRAVAADPRRATLSRRDYARLMRDAPGEPRGHGLSAANVSDGTTYGVHDAGGSLPVRLIMLDTTNLDGEAEGMTSGSIGAAQFRWLEARLREAHGRYLDEDGRLRDAGNVDRPIIVLSHHGLVSLSKTASRPPRGHEPDAERVPRHVIEALLHRHPNIVLWLNGHLHRNRVVARADPLGRGPGFWEVTTSATIDWPCQVRQVELLRGAHVLAIVTTMVDSAAPLRPGQAAGRGERLAALQRELAANDPHGGGMSERTAAGEPHDRNAVLLRRWPVPL